MKTFFYLSFVILVFSLTSIPSFAIQGDCSSHWGINCDAGSDWDGSVICNDGWRDSNDDYVDAIVCKDAETDPLGWFDLFGKTSAKATQILGMSYYKGVHALELEALDINISHDAFRGSADELLKFGDTMYQLALSQVLDSREAALKGIKTFSIDQEWEQNSIEEDFSNFKLWIDVLHKLFTTSVENAVKKHDEIIGQKDSSEVEQLTAEEIHEILDKEPVEKNNQFSNPYPLESLKFTTIEDLIFLGKKLKNNIWFLLWKPIGADQITACDISITNAANQAVKPFLQRKRLILFYPQGAAPYSFVMQCNGEEASHSSSFKVE